MLSQAINFKSGSAIRRIIVKDIKRIKVPVPKLVVQRQIVSILESAESLKNKRQQANEDTEKILQSIFLEMFGDPQTNEKGWKISTLLQVSSKKPQYGSGSRALNFDNKIRYIVTFKSSFFP